MTSLNVDTTTKVVIADLTALKSPADAMEIAPVVAITAKEIKKEGCKKQPSFFHILFGKHHHKFVSLHLYFIIKPKNVNSVF